MNLFSIELDPHQDALDGCHLDDLIERWLSSRRIDEGETMPGYRSKLQYFRQWWQAYGPSTDWILTPTAAEQFEFDLRSIPSTHGGVLSFATRRSAIHRLRQMFLWAYRTSRIPVNCGPWFPVPEGSLPKRTAVPLVQLEYLMDAARTKRDKAIIACLVGAGMRRKEACGLDVEHLVFFGDGTGIATVTGKRTRANKSGVRQVALDSATCAYLAAHIVDANLSSGSLFRSRSNTRLTPQGLYKVVKMAILSAGLSSQIQGCHDLRRLFATHFTRLKPGEAYADMLRRQLGHASYRQTTDYNLMSADDLRPHIVSPLSALRYG